MPFEILGEIREIQVIAVGDAIRDLRRLPKAYGPSRWQKLKGVARLRLKDGAIVVAEIHWHEAHGIGRREPKIKRILEG